MNWLKHFIVTVGRFIFQKPLAGLKNLVTLIQNKKKEHVVRKFFSSGWFIISAMAAWIMVFIVMNTFTNNHTLWQVFLVLSMVVFVGVGVCSFFFNIRPSKAAIQLGHDHMSIVSRYYRLARAEQEKMRTKLMDSRKKLRRARQDSRTKPADIDRLTKEKKDVQCKVDKFDQDVMEVFREGGALPLASTGDRVSAPFKDGLEIIIKDKATLDLIQKGFRTLKEEKRQAEVDYVKHGLFRIIFASVFAVVNGIFFISAKLDTTVTGFDPQQHLLGAYSVLTLVLLGTFAAFYLLLSIREVGKTERGVKFFIGMPYEEVERGAHLVAWKLGSLVKLPRSVQYYDMIPEDVLITGDESQSVDVDTSIAYHYQKLWDVVTELGTSYSVIKRKLEKSVTEEVVDNEPRETLGIIGDKVASFVRSYMASVIGDLEEALTVQDGLSDELAKILKDDLQYLGIGFERVVVRSVKPTAGMIEARDKRALTKVSIDQQTFEARARVEAAKGTKRVTVLEGEGQREVIRLRGEGEAAALKATIQADLKTKLEVLAAVVGADNDQVMKLVRALVIGEKPIAEVAKAFQGMKINIFAVPGIDKILNLLGMKV